MSNVVHRTLADFSLDEKTELLPIDDTDSLIIPPEIIAKFPTLELKENEHNDRFNSMDEELTRDESCAVSNKGDLVNLFNQYDWNGSWPHCFLGYCVCCCTCGLHWYKYKRKIIPAGYFGHYTSTGRHRLTLPGIRYCRSWDELWEKDIKIQSDSFQRQFGTKIILTVPENHLGGATRIAQSDFIVFNEGRHVLNDKDYRDVKVVNLKRNNMSDLTKLGPLRILYVREGFLGGAYKIYTGEYEIFHAGPPYLLHVKDYERIVLVQRKDVKFRLGPIAFVTVRDGFLGGVYCKKSGKYQILPSGRSYSLNSEKYQVDSIEDDIDIVPISLKFKIGPYTFLTVKENYFGGAYKRKGGRFFILPSGNSYKLHEDVYYNPVTAKKGDHMVKCGPLNFITVNEKNLAGAYRKIDGHWEELSLGREHLLHEKDYHGMVNIPKYSYIEQLFGPLKVITIQEGFIGVCENEGKMELLDPGFHRLEPKYKLLPSIPSKTYTSTIPKNLAQPCVFRSKDGAEMSMISSLVWKVNDFKKASIYPKLFDKLKDDIEERFFLNLVKYTKVYNRAELLSSKQDVISKSKKTDISDEELLELMAQCIIETENRYSDIEALTKQALVDVSNASQWGVLIIGVKLENFELREEAIINEITTMCYSRSKTALEKVEGARKLARGQSRKMITLSKEHAKNEIELQKAQADVTVRKMIADSDAECKKIASDAEALLEVIRLKTNNEVNVLRETAMVQGEVKRKELLLSITIEEKITSAKIDAQAIKLMADAEYDRESKKHTSRANMPAKQIQLIMANQSVRCFEGISRSTWRNPDKTIEFYESFGDHLRQINNQSPAALLQEMGTAQSC